MSFVQVDLFSSAAASSCQPVNTLNRGVEFNLYFLVHAFRTASLSLANHKRDLLLPAWLFRLISAALREITHPAKAPTH